MIAKYKQIPVDTNYTNIGKNYFGNQYRFNMFPDVIVKMDYYDECADDYYWFNLCKIFCHRICKC